MRVHVRCSEVLVKDIKLCKVTDGRSKCSPVRYRVLVAPSVLANEGKTPPGSPVALFFVLVRVGMCGLYVLEGISRSVQEHCVRLPRHVQSWELHTGWKVQVPDPHTATVTLSPRVSCEWCAESIPCDHSER